jgi:hypothetical protein
LFVVLTWVLWLAALVLPTGWLEVRQAEKALIARLSS